MADLVIRFGMVSLSFFHMDLDAYLQRIGYHGSREPTAATLCSLTQAHACSIPFDNIAVRLKTPILLEPDAVFDKLVTRQQGGYCFEHNGLFMAMLQTMGFVVKPLRAAVRLSQPDRQIPVGHTHLMLEVTIEGEPWITDVGMGSTSLTQALLRVEDRIQSTPHDNRRFQREGGRWFHQIQRDEEWVDICEFSQQAMPFPDQVVASWYTSTHPASSFHQALIVAKALPDGRRVSLRDNELTWRTRSGEAEVHRLNHPDALRQALREVFGVLLTQAECAQLVAALPDEAISS